MGYLYFAKTILHNLLQKPVTVTYPAGKTEVCSSYRGRVVIDIQKCISCGMCMRKCPAGALTVDRAAKSWTINRFACVQCGTCVEHCPMKCLKMEPLYAAPQTKKGTETFLKQAASSPVVKPASMTAALDQKTPDGSAAPSHHA